MLLPLHSTGITGRKALTGSFVSAQRGQESRDTSTLGCSSTASAGVVPTHRVTQLMVLRVTVFRNTIPRVTSQTGITHAWAKAGPTMCTVSAITIKRERARKTAAVEEGQVQEPTSVENKIKTNIKVMKNNRTTTKDRVRLSRV